MLKNGQEKGFCWRVLCCVQQQLKTFMHISSTVKAKLDDGNIEGTRRESEGAAKLFKLHKSEG